MADTALGEKPAGDNWRKRPKKHFVDPAWLRQVYEVERWRVGDIAAHIGCSLVHLNWMVKRAGITRRDGRAGRMLPSRRAKFDIARAAWLYEVERRNCIDIGAEMGCAGDTVRRRLREAGIRIRHHNETKRGEKARNRIALNTKAVIEHYQTRGEGAHTTAKKFGVSARVIFRVLDEAGVPRKPLNDIRLWVGEAHPSWKADLPQDERERRRDFNRQAEWRVLIFERDGYCCQKCRDDRGGNLHAHHIVAHNESRGLRWELSNGVTLCAPCHREFHRRYGMRGFGQAELDQFRAS